MKYCFVFFCGLYFHEPAANKRQTLNDAANKNTFIKRAILFFFLIQTFHDSFIHKKNTNVNYENQKSHQLFAANGDRRNKQ